MFSDFEVSYYKFVEDKKKLYKKAIYLLEKYNLDIEDYQKLSDKQGGKCLICGEKKKLFSVCFFEATKIPRALLCHPCHRRLIVPKKPEYQEGLNKFNNITIDEMKSFLGAGGENVNKVV